MRKTWAVLLAVALVASVYAGGAIAAKVPDRIWVVGAQDGTARLGPMHYGDRFFAGWESSRVNDPWGYAQCWTVDAAGNKSGAPFWDAWGFLQADGTIGIFELASVDPDQVWPEGGGLCNVSLVSHQGSKLTVTATSADFQVAP